MEIQILKPSQSITSGAGPAHPSGTHAFLPGFSGVCVSRSLHFCVVFCRSLFIPLRFTDSDYQFGKFKLFYK